MDGNQRVLSPHQFVSKFKPTEYDEDWEGVRESHTFNDRYDHAAEVEKVKSGFPGVVDVSKGGWVEDGHHRVLAALDANVSIPYRYTERRHDPDYY